MTHTLVSFLGKGRDNPKATGYRLANYRFADGTSERTPFFGLALSRHLAPDRLVLLGTAGSMWDVLIEHVALAGDGEELRLELIDAVAGQQVTQALLDGVQPIVEAVLRRSCTLRLIDYGREEIEQRDILATIAQAVPQGRISVDLTHAFRHLSMLGLVSAFFLERVGKLDVAGLYYGALDMTSADGVTPVLRLDGLTAIQRWVDALGRFDASGDYGVFCELLERDGVAPDKARCLQEAAFHERTLNLSKAREKILNFLPVLQAGLPGPGALFGAALEQRLGWVNLQSYAARQRRLALDSLARRDYMRAAVFGWEAFITQLCEQPEISKVHYGDRKAVANAFEDELRVGLHAEQRNDYRLLQGLRNALAHGNSPEQKDVLHSMRSAKALDKALGDVFARLLGR